MQVEGSLLIDPKSMVLLPAAMFLFGVRLRFLLRLRPDLPFPWPLQSPESTPRGPHDAGHAAETGGDQILGALQPGLGRKIWCVLGGFG